MSLDSPKPCDLLDSHLRRVHAELALPFPHFEVAAGRELVEPAMLTEEDRAFLDRVAAKEPGLADEPDMTQRVDQIGLAAWLEAWATQIAMALADARHRRTLIQRGLT
jgi:hypothetical protein